MFGIVTFLQVLLLGHGLAWSDPTPTPTPGRIQGSRCDPAPVPRTRAKSEPSARPNAKRRWRGWGGLRAGLGIPPIHRDSQAPGLSERVARGWENEKKNS